MTARPADSDRASFRTIDRRRQSDLDFLARIVELRAKADVLALETMAANHRKAPRWKQVAIERALTIARREADSRDHD